jgi:predicted Zn finger-like uncharacterized protein
MSLITRCPACATQFRVVPDQLKLSDGWVRCGHCSDVFDANRYLESREPSVQPSMGTVSAASTEIEVAAPTEMALPLSPKGVSTTFLADDLDVDLTLDGPGPQLDTDQAQPHDLDRFTPTPQLDQATTQQVDQETQDTSDFHNELQRFAAGQGKPPKGDRVVIPAGPAAPSPASVPTPTPIAAVQQTKVSVAQPWDGPQDVVAVGM